MSKENSAENSAFQALVSGQPTEPAVQVISHMSELAAMKPAFKRLRVDVVGGTAASHVCPAELDDGSMVILCAPEYLDSDIHKGLQALLKKQFSLKNINTRQIASIILLTLVREGIDRDYLQRFSSARDRDRSAISKAFRDIVSWAVRVGASDIHFNINNDKADSQVKVHIDGHYIEPAHLRMPTQRMLEIVRVAWLDTVGGREPIFDERIEEQARLYESVDGIQYLLRWGQFIADNGPSITLRVLKLTAEMEQVALEDMGYVASQADTFRRTMRSEGGAIVFGGVVGSGKSTIAARILGELPATRKIMTIEDPVERIIKNAIQGTVTRDLKGNGNSSGFQSKLMMLKRAAVNEVLLGEIRDRETGLAFQDIVESGSNLYTTTHVGSAAGIPSRLSSAQIGISNDLLSSPGMLKLLVYQALLPKLCSCALTMEALHKGAHDTLGQEQPGKFWESYTSRISRLYGDTSNVLVRNPEGCAHCRTKGLKELFGYQGRTVVSELFELGHDMNALRLIQKRDAIGLVEHYRSMSDGDPHSADMLGKTAMDCAAYKMLLGQIDPRDIEPRFMAFETVEKVKKP